MPIIMRAFHTPPKKPKLEPIDRATMTQMHIDIDVATRTIIKHADDDLTIQHRLRILHTVAKALLDGKAIEVKIR
jgi:hypothetical protein